MRLFVAVELPAEVGALVGAIELGEGPDVRWAEPGSWHVTLRFLGEVGEPSPVVAALGSVVAEPAVATLGRVVERLGPTALVLPVTGLDHVAAAVRAAFVGVAGEEGRPFTGHLTLGRLRRSGRWPAVRVGSLAEVATWPVGSIALVRSHLRQAAPARYEVLARHPLGVAARGA